MTTTTIRVLSLPATTDFARGFDVVTRDGKVRKHFASYAEADEYRARVHGCLRYWMKGE